MQVLRWSKAHEVAVPELDAEHRALFRLTHELREAMAPGAAPAQIRSRFRNLIAGLDDHLAHEERLMRACRCPSYAWHKRSHDGMRRKAAQCALRVERGDRDAIAPMLDELSVWLKDHLTLQDRLLASFLRNYWRRQARAS
jgi:hemerythrin-like metal-binding protein